MPMFDRMSCSIPKSQIGFVDFIINDMIEAWDGTVDFSNNFTFSKILKARDFAASFSAFVDMPEMVGYMRQNYDKWKEYNVRIILSSGALPFICRSVQLISFGVPLLIVFLCFF